jgi:uncharacterized protein (DUF433 family)
MALFVSAEPIPLKLDEHGTFRVANTRVTLDSVIAAFQNGATAEEISLQYPTLKLADIYAVITYYLRHPEEVEAYLIEQQIAADEVRKKIETKIDSTNIRERLLARKPTA